jgi:Amt family ammonium transporter
MLQLLHEEAHVMYALPFVMDFVVNNLWVAIAALLVFIMTMAVGLLEIGELGNDFDVALIKTIMITCVAVVVMAAVGFNTAFAPTIDGLVGNPLYLPGLFLGGFSSSVQGLITGTWWSMAASYLNTGLSTGSYFLFETAFAAVTFALVCVVILRKVKLEAVLIFSVIYFILIWNVPAAWIWNPTGWLYSMGVRDFAGGLVVHAAAGMAGLAIVMQIWSEERRRGLKASPQAQITPNKGWLTLSILLLWMGWFGFNPGSVLAFDSSTLVVVLTTFLAASASFVSMMFFRYMVTKTKPSIMYGVNGILMGLIIITPVAGFVSPASSMILGVIGGPLFLAAERLTSRAKWFADPIGLFPGHFVGGVFGILMIAFFTQHAFAAASGNANLPNGLLFGGGYAAATQLGIEIFGLVVTLIFVFCVSRASIWIIGRAMGGITSDEYYKGKGAARKIR